MKTPEAERVKSLTFVVKSLDEAEKEFDNLLKELSGCYDIDIINKRIAAVSGGHFLWTQKIDHIKELDVFRVTTKYPGILPEDAMRASTFSYPTNPENYGRANIPHHPVFYASMNVQTAMSETEISAGQEFYLSFWQIKPNHDLHAHFMTQYTSSSRMHLKSCLNQLLRHFYIPRKR